MAESDILERVTHKVGPLPAWAWAAIPAVGYIGWSYYRAAKADSTTAPDTGETGAPDYGLNTGGSSLPGYGTTPDGSGNLPYIDPVPFDNGTWARQAINYLIGTGANATDAVTAINAYINGYPATINSTQMAALQRAIQHLGPAPQGGTIPTGAPTPHPPPATTKVPEQPTNVVATAVGAHGGKVTWNVPQLTNGSILGYKVELYQSPPKGSTKWTLRQSRLVLASVRTVSFSSLVANTTYSFHVSARNSKGYGPYAATNFRTAVK